MKLRILLIAVVCTFLAAPLFAQGPPANSGPHVERWEMYGGDYNYWFAIVDWKRNYVAIVGVDLEAICADDTSVEWWAYWDVQDNYLPPGEILLQSVAKGEEVPTTVYPIEFWFHPTWCGAAEATDPIATGFSDVIVTDNDVYAWLPEFHPRTNAHKMSAHGLLTAFGDGEQMMFNGGYNCQWPGYPADPNTTGKCKQKIVLN